MTKPNNNATLQFLTIICICHEWKSNPHNHIILLLYTELQILKIIASRNVSALNYKSTSYLISIK